MTYKEQRRSYEHDAEFVPPIIGVDDIIRAIEVISVFNKPHYGLATKFGEHISDGVKARGKIRDAFEDGAGIFEALEREAPELADCIHDFVYQIVYPLSSITTRDLAREQVARLILNL